MPTLFGLNTFTAGVI